MPHGGGGGGHGGGGGGGGGGGRGFGGGGGRGFGGGGGRGYSTGGPSGHGGGFSGFGHGGGYSHGGRGGLGHRGGHRVYNNYYYGGGNWPWSPYGWNTWVNSQEGPVSSWDQTWPYPIYVTPDNQVCTANNYGDVLCHPMPPNM